MRTQGPRKRTREEKFFHFEPWLDNWRVRVPYAFKAAAGADHASLRDAIGRERAVPARNGTVALELTGAPVFVRGLAPEQFDTAPEIDVSDFIGKKFLGEPDDVY